MDKMVHFEIPIDDRDRAKKFYNTIFGWDMADLSLPNGTAYTNVTTVPVNDNYLPVEPGAINGDLVKRSDAVKTPVITINVSSIEEYLVKIENAGGSMVLPKQEIPEAGFYAYFKDTEGNVMGLWENAPQSTSEKHG